MRFKTGDIIWFKNINNEFYCSQIKKCSCNSDMYRVCEMFPIIGDVYLAVFSSDIVASVITNDKLTTMKYSLNFEDLINEKSNHS